jgi:ATP-binding cassette, subfamily B, bacterial PglK
MISLVIRLVRHIGRHRRYQLVGLAVLVVVSAFAEVVSLGAVMPFLGALAAPDTVLSHPSLGHVLEAWSVTTTSAVVRVFAAVFALAALAAGAVRLLLTWSMTRFAYSAGADLSAEVYRRTLYQPYRVHVSRNSSELISSITLKVGVAIGLLQSLLFSVSSAVLLVVIMAGLLAVDAVAAVVAALGFGASYGLITWFSRRRLERNGERIAVEQTRVVKALQEGLGGIRDVILDGTEPVYTKIYRDADFPMRRAQGSNAFLSQSPRYALEAMGMALIAFLAYSLTLQPGGVGRVLPVLGTLAFGAQRLLPVLQQLYLNWANLAGNRASLVDVLEHLEAPLPDSSPQSGPSPVRLQRELRFSGVGFRYSSDSPWVLENIDLTIPKGARIGFVGGTGGGKSTVLDLLMSLLEPTRGEIIVDGRTVSPDWQRAWQKSIAHVPQSIYLADATLAENIALGVPPDEIDLDRVKHAAWQAQIAEFVESRPEGYNGYVGERGIRLSGGQRQRIGIARALYKNATVLVLDEATSALDTDTERAVMDSIDELHPELTIVMVAHRLTTLTRCDMIFRLEGGRVVARGSYDSIVAAILNSTRDGIHFSSGGSAR